MTNLFENRISALLTLSGTADLPDTAIALYAETGGR